jgi:hypothetical protein
MIFSEPCCLVLKDCLADGDDRAFHRLPEGSGPLFVRAKSSLYEAVEGMKRQWIYIPVYFCPFCGRRLQAPEAVERFMKGES